MPNVPPTTPVRSSNTKSLFVVFFGSSFNLVLSSGVGLRITRSAASPPRPGRPRSAHATPSRVCASRSPTNSVSHRTAIPRAVPATRPRSTESPTPGSERSERHQHCCSLISLFTAHRVIDQIFCQCCLGMDTNAVKSTSADSSMSAMSGNDARRLSATCLYWAMTASAVVWAKIVEDQRVDRLRVRTAKALSDVTSEVDFNTAATQHRAGSL